MTKENTIGELLDRLEEQIKNPRDSVHQIVLQTTIDNINKLLNNSWYERRRQRRIPRWVQRQYH